MSPLWRTTLLTLALLATGCIAKPAAETPPTASSPMTTPTASAPATSEVYNNSIDFSSQFGDGTLDIPAGARTLTLLGTWHSEAGATAANPKFQVLDADGAVAMECALGVIVGGSAEGMTCEDEIEITSERYSYKYEIAGAVTLDVVITAS